MLDDKNEVGKYLLSFWYDYSIEKTKLDVHVALMFPKQLFWFWISIGFYVHIYRAAQYNTCAPLWTNLLSLVLTKD